MYFPYLRGKQFELSALRDYIEHNNKRNKVIPIVEPVKDKLPPLEKTIADFTKHKQHICLIVNPLVGDIGNDTNVLHPSLIELVNDRSNVVPALLITTNTSTSTINTFLDQFVKVCLVSIGTIQDHEYMKSIRSSSKVKFHVLSSCINRRYRKDSARLNNTILLNDSFPTEKKNADYPEDNPFSDEIFFFSEEQRLGFSDFTLLPNEYNDAGGPAWAVTIHLSYEIKEMEIRVRHFTSDVTNTNTDPGGKFLQALRKLINWADANTNLVYESNGMKEFRGFNAREHYPGLGYLKKTSIIHHLELCNNILNR